MSGATVEVRDDTHKHLDHNEQVGHDGSHFLVRVIWDGFEGMSRIVRHRTVFGFLDRQWAAREIHSLSLRLLTTQEAQA